MPELPEVETVRQTLRSLVLGEKISGVTVLYENIIKDNDLDLFKNTLIGKRINEISRKGKYLIFELDDDYSLISHLRMEGKYYYKLESDEVVKHEHIIFHFESGMTLRYHDVRKFGTMEIRKKDELFLSTPLNKLGMDANLVSGSYLKERMQNKHMDLKSFLLNQEFIAGIGNIYADEICFLSKLHPKQDVYYLNEEDFEAISKNSKEVLEKAILAGGTTIRSYTSSLGVTGLFQLDLMVHTKVGSPCPNCGNEIIKTRVSGRGTYLCPNCQKIR
jgi:formamidopyrimidine-DNA glycosylase